MLTVRFKGVQHGIIFIQTRATPVAKHVYSWPNGWTKWAETFAAWGCVLSLKKFEIFLPRATPGPLASIKLVFQIKRIKNLLEKFKQNNSFFLNETIKTLFKRKISYDNALIFNI